ncbi:hypothetical protein Slin15195_G084500 [Septoria linicola]|uniref:Xylanolytic transcriptional activator regulatory domain-containing protein n=1 Tax=Septoria linicola TaxID=215465 RepID=A0A9Q9B0L5_9PEZI|nr:hypothetical protein Slin15195_G084500 [Septoria linicola]
MLEGGQQVSADGQDSTASGSKRAGSKGEAQRAKRPKKRGIQPNYIRTLELTLAWIFEQFPETEKSISHVFPGPQERAHQLIAWKDVPQAETLHTAWRNSIVCRQIDQLLSGASIEKPSLAIVDPSPQVQASREVYQSPPLSAPSDAGAFGTLSPRRGDAVPETFPIENRSLLVSSDETHASEELLKLPLNSWALLEHYFAFTHTWLPMIERHDVLKLMYTYPQNGMRRQDTAGSGHAELWSIMALASLQTGATADFSACRATARSLVPDEQGFQLGHIKALLILGLTDVMKRSWISAWLVVGSAVRLLTHFNLGKGTSTTLFEGRTKHTLLAAFVLERALASQSGAVTHIRPADIQNVGFLIEDGLEEWSPWQDPSTGANSATAKAPARSISTFNELVKVALQLPRDQGASPGMLGVSHPMSAISALLENAGNRSQRVHPSQLLASHKSNYNGGGSTPGSHVRQNSTQMQFSAPFGDNSHYFSMSIPNETAESLAGSTPANNMQRGAGPSNWTAENTLVDMQESAGIMGDPGTVNTAPGADIFEELAMLDRTDSSTNPSFMQNLGFGPDLDLAEFFGADYQPSDPLLTYMQPSMAGDFDATGNDAG